MATVSTIPTVKARIVTVLTAATTTSGPDGGALQVTYAWPGPNTLEHEAIFLGFHPALRDIRLDADHDIPTIKAGRKQRQENYTIPMTIWTFRPDLDADEAATAEARAFTLLGLVEDEFADDVNIGLANAVIHHLQVESISTTLFPFETGWACALEVDVTVRARLT